MRGRSGTAPTAELVDVMDDLGLREQTLPPSIRALFPGMRAPAARSRSRGVRPRTATGTRRSARPSRCSAPSPPGTSPLPVRPRALGALRRAVGDVARDARRRRLRDRRRLPRPAPDRGARVPRLRPLRDPGGLDAALGGAATQAKISIGAVRIEPGDWIVGNEDGVVSVPAAVAERVLVAAEARVGTENLVRDAVRSGMTPLEAYDRFGTF